MMVLLKHRPVWAGSSCRVALLTRSNASSREMAACSCIISASTELPHWRGLSYLLVAHLRSDLQVLKRSIGAFARQEEGQLLDRLPDLEMSSGSVPCHGPLCVFVEDDV